VDSAVRTALRVLNPRWWVGGVIVIAVAATVQISDRMLNGEQGQEYHQQLAREFSLIGQPKFVGVVSTTDVFSKWEPRRVLVGADYTSSSSYSAILEYYDQQMTALGWRFAGERPLRDWGRDFGGRVRDYCKGPLSASLQYAGERANYGWTYAIDLSWSTNSSCR